jgi:hypothetical protein
MNIEEYSQLTTDKKLERLYVLLDTLHRQDQEKQMKIGQTLKITENIMTEIRELKTLLVESQFKTPTVEEKQYPAKKPTPDEDLPPTKEDLKKALGDQYGLLDTFNGETIEPTEFLGDRWGNINMTLEAMGYRWIRDGKSSHWKFQGEETPQPQTSQTQQAQSKTAEWIPTRSEVEQLTENWKESQYGKYAYSRDHPRLAEAIRNSYQQRLDYGNLYFKLGGDDDYFINMSPRKFGIGEAPSDKQISFATKLGIDHPEMLDKGSLSVKMADVQLEQRRNKQ